MYGLRNREGLRSVMHAFKPDLRVRNSSILPMSAAQCRHDVLMLGRGARCSCHTLPHTTRAGVRLAGITSKHMAAESVYLGFSSPPFTILLHYTVTIDRRTLAINQDHYNQLPLRALTSTPAHATRLTDCSPSITTIWMQTRSQHCVPRCRR